jgi:L-seryl-tRNA(Ser) seleniumtransferase
VIAALKRHPLTRALRVSKSILAGLQATLLHYLKGEAVSAVPVWQMMAMETSEIEARARDLVEWLRARQLGTAGTQVEVIDGWSRVGGGSLPEETLPTRLVALRVPAAHELAQTLRLGSPAVIGRIENDAFVLDLRTVLPGEDAALRRALEAAL